MWNLVADGDEKEREGERERGKRDRDSTHQNIDLLKRLAPGFREEEVYHEHGEEVAGSEEVARQKGGPCVDERGGKAGEEVASPLRRGAEGDARSAVARRIDFRGDGPCLEGFISQSVREHVVVRRRYLEMEMKKTRED